MSRMFRSNSGPNLSINTASANATGNLTQSKPLFGAPALGAASTAQPSSLFGAGPVSSNPPQANAGLFGGTGTPNQSTNLFGTTSVSQQPSNSLFGNSNNQSKTVATSGNLFGQAPISQAQQPTTSLFGNVNATANAAAPVSLFGSTTTAQTGPQSSSLFGNNPVGQTNTSLFSQSQSGPAFLQQPGNSSVLLGSIGRGNASTQNTVPGVRISVNELRPSTRFNDLHEELQKAVEHVDAFVLNKIQWQEQCDAANGLLSDLSSQLSPDIDYCSERISVVQQALQNDAEEIAATKDLVKQDAVDAKLSFKVINNLKLPQQFHHANLWNSSSVHTMSGPRFTENGSEDNSSGHGNLVDYFSKQSMDLTTNFTSYKARLKEVESYVKNLEASTMHQLDQVTREQTSYRNEPKVNTVDDHIRELAAVLRDFEAGILKVAGHVGDVRERALEVMLQ